MKERLREGDKHREREKVGERGCNVCVAPFVYLRCCYCVWNCDRLRGHNANICGSCPSVISWKMALVIHLKWIMAPAFVAFLLYVKIIWFQSLYFFLSQESLSRVFSENYFFHFNFFLHKKERKLPGVPRRLCGYFEFYSFIFSPNASVRTPTPPHLPAGLVCYALTESPAPASLVWAAAVMLWLARKYFSAER